jgi:dTMP kinase
MTEIIQNFVVFFFFFCSGTTTQLSILKEKLKNSQKPVFFPTFEPTDSPTGRLIRAAFKKETTVTPQTLCHLFATDRNEHLYGQDGILSHAAAGELVISDRYVISSFVYQGIECGDELPKMLNSYFPIPEITIFLDIKPQTALERLKNRSSLDIYEYLDFQEKVNKKYISTLEIYGKTARVETIDASKNIREVADSIWSILSQMPIFN